MKKLIAGISICLGLWGLGIGEVKGQNNGGVSTQAVYVGPVQPSQVVPVVRAAKPLLECENNCSYTMGFLVSRYHQGQLQIVYLGNWEEKDWFRVIYGGGTVISAVEDDL